jgi:FAD/FMN-containing dehydrogenase
VKVLSDPGELAPFGEDYGRLATRPPKVVVKPRGPADVQRAVEMARREGLTIRARSGGHGLEGQSLNQGGMVIVTDDMVLPSGERIELDRGENLVRVVPGVRTGEVERFLAASKLRLPSTTMDGFPRHGRRGVDRRDWPGLAPPRVARRSGGPSGRGPRHGRASTCALFAS